ncbi:hypothetical protein GCM10028803_07260 [Larkinella knui]|uniref:Lipocalin-like domain-containing protein n=1 Tax=Larkinella knui TaxID=2025310 RepID=A0A3P1CK71_9BACT|nr:hypothetical protein [Larkinella knui]RRB13600.1 hypothetical protein EHT87_15170 [Larkinella knui]
MKKFFGTIAPLLPLLFLAIGCKKDNGFDAGGPVTSYLLGKWQLEKIVSPSGTKVGPQIGYSEMVEIGNDGSGDYEKLFRNGSLLFTDSWLRSPAPVASSKNLTITVFYFNHGKRFFKLTGKGDTRTMEASDYIPEAGARPDTVRYFYSLMH